MKFRNKGDLVYIPSYVQLYKLIEYDDGVPIIKLVEETTEPKNVLFVGDTTENFCQVYYNGDYWHVSKNDVCEAKI